MKVLSLTLYTAGEFSFYVHVTASSSDPGSPCRALRVRKKMSGDRMPVKMIGDILTNQLPHMQPYIRFCFSSSDPDLVGLQED